jgi:predicted signal transduction protein with EAL and GGDEF domain
LKQLASRIQAALDGCGTIARLSGDEFAILVRGDEGLAAAAFDTVQSALEEPLAIGDTQRTCTASIGATKFPEDATEAGDLLKNADLALYRAKSLGRDRIVQFEPSMRSAMGRKVELQQEAREALRHGQFRLHYQPIVPASTAQPLSFEALLRWQHPNHGLLAPGSFEEVLEDPRLAMTIGDAVIDMALAQAAQWLSEGKEFGRIAVNVTSADFSFGDFAGRLNEKLDHHRVPASKLCIEVTERVFLGVGATHVAEALQRISALGVEVALDDFWDGVRIADPPQGLPDRSAESRSVIRDGHAREQRQPVDRAGHRSVGSERGIEGHGRRR